MLYVIYIEGGWGLSFGILCWAAPNLYERHLSLGERLSKFVWATLLNPVWKASLSCITFFWDMYARVWEVRTIFCRWKSRGDLDLYERPFSVGERLCNFLWATGIISLFMWFIHSDLSLMLNLNVLKKVEVLLWQDFTSLLDLHERPFFDLYERLFILYERPENFSYEWIYNGLDCIPINLREF